MNKIKPIDTIGDSGCPCGVYDDGKTQIIAHCWKSGSCKYNCDYSGVHYFGELKTARRIAKRIAADYHTDVNIIVLKKRPNIELSK